MSAAPTVRDALYEDPSLGDRVLLRLRLDKAVGRYELVVSTILTFVYLLSALGMTWIEGPVGLLFLALSGLPLWGISRSLKDPNEIVLTTRSIVLRWEKRKSTRIQLLPLSEVERVNFFGVLTGHYAERPIRIRLRDGTRAGLRLAAKGGDGVSPRYEVVENITGEPFEVVDGVPNHVDAFARVLAPLCPPDVKRWIETGVPARGA